MTTDQVSIATISKLSLSPGDILVLRAKRRLFSTEYQNAFDQVKDAIREAGIAFVVPVLVIDGDAEFQVISGGAHGGGGLESLTDSP